MERKRQEQFVFGSIFLFANKLQALGDRQTGDVTMKQWLLLIMVKNLRERDGRAEQGLTINRLADFMGYSRQNTKKTLALLEGKGYVRMRPCPADGRSKMILLTEKSYDFFEKHEALGDSFLDRVYEGMDGDEVSALYGAFKKVGENISTMTEEEK